MHVHLIHGIYVGCVKILKALKPGGNVRRIHNEVLHAAVGGEDTFGFITSFQKGEHMQDRWPYEPGQKIRRSTIHEQFGEGNHQNGIVPLKKRNDILLFSSVKKRYSYAVEEGLRDDGTVAYIGMGGGIGNAAEQEVNNKAVINSSEKGTALRLFSSDSPYVTYVGKFTLDDVPYCFQPEAAAANDRFIVFNLIPVGKADLAIMGAAPAPLSDITEGVPSAPAASSSDSAFIRKEKWVEKNETTVMRHERELTSTPLVRDEMKLQNQFGHWLENLNHIVRDVSMKDMGQPLYADLFDATTNIVIEAKVSQARGFVRTAIGQSLDYAHCMNLNLESPTVRPGILLPGIPTASLLSLCKEQGIILFISNDDGSFTVLPEANASEYQMDSK